MRRFTRLLLIFRRPAARTWLRRGLFAAVPFFAFWTAASVLFERGGFGPESAARRARFERDASRDSRLLQEHALRAAHHPYGFNDHPPPPKKPPGIRTRIIVLGDSFIYGDGIPLDEVWSRKLEKKIRAVHPGIELLHWGRCAWSTLDQLEFLEKEFGDRETIYDADWILLAYVLNDPDLRRVPFRPLRFRRVKGLAPLAKFFPYLAFRLERRLEEFFYRFPGLGIGYAGWIHYLYTPENLARYRTVLSRLGDFVRKRNARLLAVITPDGYDPTRRRFVELSREMFREQGIPVIDFFDAFCERFADREDRVIRASSVNFHPGPLLTEFFAEKTFQALQERDFFDALDTNRNALPGKVPSS